MKKILVVTTGGTIGSAISSGVIHTEQNSCRALELYRRQYGTETDFEVLPLMNLLSENCQPMHWQKIAETLLKIPTEPYSGIIITHGSDTLSYTSAFLGLTLCALPLPIVLTAADRVPDDPQSNALPDLRSAVQLIRQLKRGVLTVYRNPGEQACRFYPATRICEADRLYGRFTSFDGHALGQIQNNSIRWTHPALSQADIEAPPSFVLKPQLQPDRQVLMVRPYPGLDYASLMLTPRTAAVLHITYHSSSACTADDNSALLLLRRCREKGIPFYLASFPNNPQALYDTSSCLLREGAIPLRHLSDEAAYAKLLLCVNLPAEQRDVFMNTCRYWEYV